MLTDTSPMPFGKYGPPPKGCQRLMQDVPAYYLHHLWVNGLEFDRRSQVADYIRRNLTCLQQESPDLIWETRKKLK